MEHTEGKCDRDNTIVDLIKYSGSISSKYKINYSKGERNAIAHKEELLTFKVNYLIAVVYVLYDLGTPVMHPIM